MSLLGNLKKGLDAAKKKLQSLVSRQPAPTKTTYKPATWGIPKADISKASAVNFKTANTTPQYAPAPKLTIPKPSSSGGMSYVPGTSGGMSMVPPGGTTASSGGGKVGGGGGGGGGGSRITTPSYMSLASPDYSYGLGDISSMLSTTGTGTGTGTYTGTKTGTQSTGGGGGAGGSNSVSDQLSALEKQKAQLEAELAKMLAQSETAADSAVTSDTEEVNYEKDAIKKLKDAGLWPGDDALKLLNDEIKRNEQNLKENLSNINAGYGVQQTGLQGQQLNETGQTSMAIANAGGYLGFSGSGTGVMLKLAESHRAELVALESERQNALQEARNAAAERRFDIVRLKADEIARIDQERYERVQEYNAEVKKQVNADLERAKKLKVEEDIMGAIMAGNTSVEDIYNAMGGGATIDEIRDTLDGVTKRSTVAGGFKISAANVAKFLGTGMTQDDVNALQEYVNENGYDETVRSSLSATARVVADKVFGTTGTAGPSTAVMPLTDLARVEDQYGVQFPYGVTKGEVEQFLQDNWGQDPQDMQDAIDEIFGKQTTSNAGISFTEEYLRANLTESQLKQLADKTGASSWWSTATVDIDRMFDNTDYVQKLNSLIADARSAGYDDSEILDYLTN